MADFAQALRRTLRNEGVEFDAEGIPVPGRTGYVNDPADHGGETNYGITIEDARKALYTGSMRDLPFAMVKAIYRGKYWAALSGDDITSQAVADELFDAGVNVGVGTEVRFLQRVLNALNDGGRRWADLPTDGGLGPATLEALNAAVSQDEKIERAIVRGLDVLQGAHYIELCEKHPRVERFLKGWLLNR